jgi:hypothetical protein
MEVEIEEKKYIQRYVGQDWRTFLKVAEEMKSEVMCLVYTVIIYQYGREFNTVTTNASFSLFLCS